MLAYHVVPAAAMGSNELAEAGQAETLLGLPLEVTGTAPDIAVGEAGVDEPDVDAANGVVHGVDEVLTPPEEPAPPQTEPPEPPDR